MFGDAISVPARTYDPYGAGELSRRGATNIRLLRSRAETGIPITSWKMQIAQIAQFAIFILQFSFCNCLVGRWLPC